MVRLRKVIAPSFFSVHRQIREGRKSHFWLKGGRGSGKSSFVSLEMVLGVMRERNTHGIVLRKVASYLRQSVVEQIRWAIDILDVGEMWQERVSEMAFYYLPTGQKILFRGGEEPQKLKSMKFPQGYPKWIWYEEVDEFSGAEEIRSINQTLMRGGEEFCIFYTFNPPRGLESWVNQAVLQRDEEMMVHHSTYLDLPEGWLGAPFYLEAIRLQKADERLYRQEYLGEVTGYRGQVFSNVVLRPIREEEIQGFWHVSRGVDWGYAVDPFHYTVNHYDRKKRQLYIFYEIHQTGLSNRRAAEMIRKENLENGVIFCDSAEPKSISEFCTYGLRAVAAKKGARSVAYGIRWLQDLEEIVIDPVRCPKTAAEFSGYHFQEDGQGGFLGRYPDRDNHAIDAVRYSRQVDMERVKVR